MKYTEVQRQRLLSFFYMSGVSHLDFAILSNRDRETPLMRHHLGIQRTDCDRIIRYAGYANLRESANIFIRPARKCNGTFLDHAMLFIDDVPADAVEKICSLWSAAIVETSKASYQAWIRTRWPLDEKSRATAQSALAQKFGTDPASTSGEHYGRLPGFRNRKPTRNNAWVNMVTVSGGALLDPAPYLRKPSTMERLVTSDAKVIRPANGVDASAAEFGFALNALKNGADPAIVRDNLLRRAILRRRTPADAQRYVDLTMSKCLGIVGSR